jgi:single-stranded-DNA-specific exonuclease
MRWSHTPGEPEDVAALARAVGVSPVVAELLVRGGWTEAGAAQAFLRPELAGLADPFAIDGVAAVVARLAAAIAAGESVVVLGDYDVDGVSSTALLVTVLRRFGLEPRFVVPRRAEDGYGLSRSAIERALEGTPGATLFVALDCGTNSHEEVGWLIGRGLDVIVVDHHRSKERPLAQGLLVNPHVRGRAAPPESRELPASPGAGEAGGGTTAAESPWLNLCTVGLVFKVVHGLLKRLRAESHPIALRMKLRDELDLVALGTVADLVPLRGENRILARHGLRVLQETQRPGLRALMDVSGIARGQAIAPADIAFRLGPRINASGRLADAALSVDLLLSENSALCLETARQLDAFNRERQEIERKITDEADELVETRYRADPGIVLFSEDWHPGVVGIVAGRVSRHHHRPCIVLGNEGDQAKGSGRSVDGVNLVEILGRCSEHLSSWGGHPMAVGVALPKLRLEDFRGQFAAAVRAHVGSGIPERRLELAAWLKPDMIDEGLMEELEGLHPFGQGNPQPVFGLGGIVLRRRPEVFKERHFRFWLEGARGRPLHGVAWKMAERLPPVGEPVDLAVELGWNHFNDRRLLQLGLIDWRAAGR